MACNPGQSGLRPLPYRNPPFSGTKPTLFYVLNEGVEDLDHIDRMWSCYEFDEFKHTLTCVHYSDRAESLFE